MKQSLQLKLGQQLTMTPQLQQAIRLLQLSTLDLQQEIQEALESNPMLEMEEEVPQQSSASLSEATASLSGSSNESGDSDSYDEPSGGNEMESMDNIDNIPTDLPVDSNWEDVYQGSLSGSGSGGDDDEDGNFESRNASAETLLDHLEWQLNLTRFSDIDRAIAYAIIESINPNGYLTVSLEDILESVTTENEVDPVELDEIQAVLHRIQQFDPPGVAARDLKECLLIQLNQMPEGADWVAEAKLVVQDHLELLGNHDYAQLMRKTKLNEEALRNVIRVIQALNPQPGARIASVAAEYVVPDVIVRKMNGRWRVELNPDAAPRLRINANYASLVQRVETSSDSQFLRNHLQEARWFIKSLQSRNETLLKVATKIVEYQRGFLDYGPEAMKPLVLADIAEQVGMHESTISRVTTQKFMHTPQGIFELKYFFSSHVSTASGGECSSTAIRSMIKKLVSAEDPRRPLSDSKIAELLEKQDIIVARRTIAKYRESLQIPPSNERKRLV